MYSIMNKSGYKHRDCTQDLYKMFSETADVYSLLYLKNIVFTSS